MARYQINHRTVYQYAQPVAVSHHAARLRPLDEPGRQTCRQYVQSVLPQPQDLSGRKDFFGNTVSQFSIQQPYTTLIVDCNSEVEVMPLSLPLADLTPTCEEVRGLVKACLTPDCLDALQFIYPSTCIALSPEIKAFAEPFFADNSNLLRCACALAAQIHDTFTFDPTATDVSTPPEEVLSLKRGVCQDFAHLMIAAMRSCGLPARYVSGYILTHPPAGQQRLVGADASHAWVSVFVPNYGWLDIDPTNRQFATEEHITVARGRDFADVTLLSGAVTGGGEQIISISVTVTPLEDPESPRVPLEAADPKLTPPSRKKKP